MLEAYTELISWFRKQKLIFQKSFSYIKSTNMQMKQNVFILLSNHLGIITCYNLMREICQKIAK